MEPIKLAFSETVKGFMLTRDQLREMQLQSDCPEDAPVYDRIYAAFDKAAKLVPEGFQLFFCDISDSGAVDITCLPEGALLKPCH